MRFVNYADRKPVAAALRTIYTAPTIEAAEAEFDHFKDSPWGRKYPTTVRTWESAWERFIPFLGFPPAVRKIIYTTNAIVISSARIGVFDVRHGSSGSLILLVGRGYLQPSRRHGVRRKSACYTGGFAGLTA